MLRPTIGRIVWFYPDPNDPELRDLPDAIPAIITRAHSAEMVNLTAFPDGRSPAPCSFVQRADIVQTGARWQWPELVSE